MTEKSNTNKQNGDSNTSRRNSKAGKSPITGNSVHEQVPAKQSTSAAGKKRKQTFQPLPTITEPTLIAELLQDNIALMRNAGFFVSVVESDAGGLPVINMLLAAPKGYETGIDDEGRVFVCASK